MRNKPDFYVASDYAGLEFSGGSFYYGYEHSICSICGTKNDGEFCDKHENASSVWCFVASFDGQEIVIPSSKLGASDSSDVVECLNTGIGWVLAKYKLVLKE